MVEGSAILKIAIASKAVFGKLDRTNRKRVSVPQTLSEWVGVLSGLAGLLTFFYGLFRATFVGKPGQKTIWNSNKYGLVFAVIAVSSAGFSYYDRHYANAGAYRPTILQQGVIPGSFMVTIDGSKLLSYAPKDKVMLIVAAPLAGTDPITDSNIVKIELYTITNDPITLTTFGTAFPDKRFVPNYVTFSIAIYPGDLPPNNIGSLGDVTRLGGKIVATSSHAGQVMPVIPQIAPLHPG